MSEINNLLIYLICVVGLVLSLSNTKYLRNMIKIKRKPSVHQIYKYHSTEDKGTFKIETLCNNLYTCQTKTTKPKETSHKTVKHTNKTKMYSTSYTEDDLYCMACSIYCEHGGDEATDTERILDGDVILNRVHSKQFPNTIRGVLEAKNQYEGFENGVHFPSRAKSQYEQKAVKRAYRIAKEVLNGKKLCPNNVVYQAEFTQGSGVWQKIGNTYYCYE